jgi:phosphoglycolate phosphatase
MTRTALNRVTCVLFDLDGTLIDSAPGITRCLAQTIRDFGGPSVSPASLVPFVGPPVVDTLRGFTDLPQSRLPDAVEHYRALYLESGIAQSSVFAGIPALLGMLRELRIPAAVATSKRTSHARAILDQHNLASAFVTISGAAEDDSAADKPAVIAAALHGLGRSSAHPVLVGDRSFDMRGAEVLDIPAVFAGWGYGDVAEAEGAAVIANHPDEVAAALRPHLIARTTQGVQ